MGLHRYRPQGEELEAGVARVAGKIDEDVDAVAGDALERIAQRRVAEIGEDVEGALKALEGEILARTDRIAVPGEALAAVRLEQAAEDGGDAVLAEVRRDVSDA